MVTYGPGEFAYTMDSLVESNGQNRDDTATANAEVGLESEDGDLDRVWKDSGFDMRETVTASVSQGKDFDDKHRDFASRERLFWSAVYNSSGDVELSSDDSTSPDSSGEPHSEVKETINYSSYKKDTRQSLTNLDNWDYLRNSSFEQILTSTDGGPAVASGDTQVIVTGQEYWEHMDDNGLFEWLRLDLATGDTMWDGSGDGNNEGDDWDMRTPYEHWLDGSGSEPMPESETDDGEGIPDDGYYPSNPNPGAGTWTAWFAGQRGDSLDQGINFSAGFADNVTMNASWVFRSQIMGTDTVDYDGGYYSGGQWVGFAVQAPGMAVAGVKTAVTGVKSLVAAANSVDDVGRCANQLTRLVHGGCFVPGTLVTLSELPRTAPLDEALWSTDNWQNDFSSELLFAQDEGIHQSSSATATLNRLLIPIEDVPLGARVPTKNHKPWEYDDSLPEPAQETWAVLSLTVERSDGGVVDAELLRPREWIERYGIEASQLLPLNIEELQVQGLARVNSVTPAPRIAKGEGSTVTGRFVTRQVDIIARTEVLGGDGQVEIIEGTTIHPIWSLDRDDWVPLGEIEEGEQLLGSAGAIVVLSHVILQRTTPVYNIEVHGEHVYEVGELGLLVHNTCSLPIINPSFVPLAGLGTKAVVPALTRRTIAGPWPAVFKNGEVFVHYMHATANMAANSGRIGRIAESGWAWLDDLGTVVKVVWQ